MNLRATVSEVGGKPVVALTGPVDLASVPELHNALARAIRDHPGQRVAVDLDAVTSLDDVGLGVILGAAGRARRGGGDVVIITTNDRYREHFSLTRLDRAVTVMASLTGAA